MFKKSEKEKPLDIINRNQHLIGKAFTQRKVSGAL